MIDNNARRAIEEYKNCDGSVDNFPKEMKRTEWAINRLCVIIPSGYTNSGVEADLNFDYNANN